MTFSINDFSSGINKWRDSRTPRQILEKYCETNNFHKPRFFGNNRVIFHADEYFLEDFGKVFLQFTPCTVPSKNIFLRAAFSIAKLQCP